MLEVTHMSFDFRASSNAKMKAELKVFLAFEDLEIEFRGAECIWPLSFCAPA